MRKGSWLNRPIIVKQYNETNEYDVAVAKVNALPSALNAVKQYGNQSLEYYFELNKIIDKLT